MTITVRASSAAGDTAPTIEVPKPPGTVAGDSLWAVHFNDEGLGGTTVSGWTSMATGSRNGMFVRVSRKTAGLSEPATYTFGQPSDADGTVHIIAVTDADQSTAPNIVITGGSSQGAATPNVTPAGAPHLEIRVAAVDDGGLAWSAPPGYVLRGAASDAIGLISSAAASKVINSSASSGVQSFSISPAATRSDLGVSISIASATTQEPEIPTYPPFTPARGTALYSYRVRRLRDGQFLGFLDLENVTFDKRISAPGTFSATIPIPNRRIADLVAEVIPRDSSVLSAGPGVIVLDVLRGGDIWGEYWITRATPSRSGRGTPSIQLQGTTLDGWLSAVEIQTELFYEQLDQIDIMRGLLADLQGQPFSNIGLTVAPGTCGVLRDRQYGDDGGTYGQRIKDLSEVNNGFEYTIDVSVVDGTIARQIRWGYPTLASAAVEHVFADGSQGGDIIEWQDEIDALRGATRWRARGGTPPSDADASVTAQPIMSAVYEATDHLQWWPRIDRTLSYSDVIVQETIDDYAAYWASVAPGALRVESYTVVLGANPSLHPNRLGDWARIFLDNEWHRPHWRERRIIGMQIKPVGRDEGKEEARLVLEGLDVGGPSLGGF
ncbi:hypothetical protein ABZ897_00940 [Nonomuraea sp. NPDC046802]|uniref:hypothetical protein n=1 Tax=Nonomuraea sp. NPDC046802 TaxID=3154919 RepID=UPI0033C8F498